MSVTQSGVDSLFEQNAGRVFAYCYARVGSRNVAEWAVNATFDRARAALANGGISEPELDWLLRTADKFCAPKLCLDVRPLESMVVLQDWQGRTFDEIANELEARYARLEEERNRLTPWRRLLSALNVGPAFSWVKGLVGGLGAVKATAAGVALVGAVAIVGTPLGAKLHDVVRSDSTPSPPASPTSTSSGAPLVAPAQQAGNVTRQGPGSAGANAKHANGAQARHGGKAGPHGGGQGSQASTAAGAGAPGTGSSSEGEPQTPSGVSASSPVTTTPATGQKKPSSKGPGATLPGVIPTTPDQVVSTSSVPTPTMPTATLPTVDTSTVPSVNTPTVETPTVDTPSAPSTSPPIVDTPTLPNVDTPPAPTVSTPTVPSTGGNTPGTGNVTVPTVTLPKP